MIRGQIFQVHIPQLDMGNNSNSLIIPASEVISVNNGWKFRCIVSSTTNCSPSTSSIATLSVSASTIPTINTQPLSQTFCSGSNASISISASGPSLSYQWQSSSSSNGTYTNISGATNTTLAISTSSASTNYYKCIVTEACGSLTTTSDFASILVSTSTVVSASITSTASTICQGASKIFTASSINGGLSPTYSWYKNGTVISGQTAATFSTNDLSNGDAIYATVTSDKACAIGSPSSSNTIFTIVNSLPSVNVITGLSTVNVGSTITLTNATPSGVWSSSSSSNANISSGTVTGISEGASTISYTVTDNQTPSCSNSTTKSITINAQAPSSLSYTTPNVYTVGTSITPLNPTLNGGAVTSYTITPSLPVGLVINGTTGIISGTPTVSSPTSNYSVTASNSGGSVSAVLSIEVQKLISTIVATGTTSFTYNRSAQGPSTSNVSGSTATPTYSYSGTGTTTYGPSAIAPTMAGTYQMIATVADDAIYYGASSSAFAFTIILDAPSVLSINKVEASPTNRSTLNYIVTFSKPIIGFDISDLSIINTGTVTSTSVVINAISASTYSVTISGINGNGTLGLNLNSSGTGITDQYGTGIINSIAGQVFTIDKITISPSIINLSTNGTFLGQYLPLSYLIPEVSLPNSTSITFHGISNNVVINLNNTSGSISGTFNTYNLNSSSIVSSSSQSTLPADVYTITLGYQDFLGNPVAITSINNFYFNNNLTSTIVVTGLTTYTYNGTAQGPVTSTVTGSTSTPTYSYSGTGSTSYGPSSTRPTSAGTYQVIATVTGDANYNGATSTAYAFTINNATSTIVVTGLTTYTYNGTAQGPVTSTVTGSTSTPTYSYSGNSSISVFGPSTIAPKLPGTYQVVATVTGDANYNGATSTAFAFNIIQIIPPPIVDNGLFISNQPNLPTHIDTLVVKNPIGTIPVWCEVNATNCVTVAPKFPTIIGKYVYQLRSYDTTTLLYSTNFINDTIVITPPKPVAFDSTYVIGVASNPSNVSLQVSGLAGASFNYYYLNNKLTSVPTLGNTVGVKKYTVSQTVNTIEGDTTSFSVTMLDPASIIHLQKIVDSGKLLSNSTFNYPFTFLVSNLTKYPFSNVVVTDNLHNSVPITSDFSVISNTATGRLIANSRFDGMNDINVTSSSVLAPFAIDTSRFTMNLVPKGYTGSLSNIAYVKADTKWGTILMQSSASATNGTYAATTYYVKDLPITIPEGFSPNHDGVHDYLVIIKPFNVTLDLQIFNRWGNIVYANSNYKNEWDGKGTGNFAGQDLVDGGYYYTLRAVDDKGATQVFNGYVIIQR